MISRSGFWLLLVLGFSILFITPYVQASPPFEVDTTRIDQVFMEYDRQASPGCALGLTYEGELFYKEGYGMANLNHRIPIVPDTRFMVASISKQFTAASLILLEQQGELDLDENLRSYLPELPEFEEPITARQLIHHTSGLRDLFHLLYINGRGLDPETGNEVAMEMIRNQKDLNFSPGSRHIYSNSGYFLISMLVEEVSGQSLREFTNEHFFEPSGMDKTHFHDDYGEIVPNRSMSYRPTSDGPGEFYRGNINRVGARGLFTTIEDMAEWDRNFYDNRTPIENFEERMTERGRTTGNYGLNYATGLRLGDYKTLATVGHGGSYMGFRTNYMRFPDEKLGIITFCNMSGISPATHSRQVADIVLEETFNQILEPYAGVYRNEAYDATYQIELKDGDLYLERVRSPRGRLLWQNGDAFRAGGWEFTFETNENGEYERFYMSSSGVEQITFKRVEQSDE